MDDSPNISAIGQICLRVRDTKRSSVFYRAVLGLEEVPGPADSPEACVLQCCCGGAVSQLTLVEGLPPGDHLIGLDHFTFTVPSSQDVEAVYRKAESAGCRVTKPRASEGRWQLFVFDPDGYKLAVTSPRRACDSQTMDRAGRPTP
jgi:catechol 2,3-dioxygenase-like lactoylglutathione lyase family enzyme